MKISTVKAYFIFSIVSMVVSSSIVVAQIVPAEKSQLNDWFSENVKPFSDRKAELDPVLVTAEENAVTVTVKQDGSGDFKTITDAINSVPMGNTRRVLISIGGGVYNEKITIDRSKPFITLIGSPNNMPNLTFNGKASQYGTLNSATLIVESDYFTAANLIIVNSSPRPDGKQLEQAVAARIAGDKSVAYNCKFIGFQDTLNDDTGLHLFKDCYVEGTVDFIFGRGTSLYLNTVLNVLGDGGFTVITAQLRPTESDNSAYTFAQCSIIGSGGRNTYLGRYWRNMSRVIYAYTDMADIITPAGWDDKNQPQLDKMLMFGEYECSGPGANRNGRVSYSRNLTETEVNPFISLDYIQSSTWLLPPPNTPYGAFV